MKTSEILAAALTHLWDGESINSLKTTQEFVCHAVRETKLDESMHVRREIVSRLEGATEVAVWLSKKGFREVYNASNKERQDYRRRWMLSMIAEFQAKGD